jgi:hypothetical protein
MVSLNREKEANRVAKGWESGVVEEESAVDVAQIASMFLWSPIEWANGVRSESGFLGCRWVVLDFDEDKPLQWAMDTYRACRGFIGTTKSHQKEKNGKICDRYRVAFLMQTRCTNLRAYKATLARRAEALGADKKCVDGARFFYPCTEIVQIMNGSFLPTWDAAPTNASPFPPPPGAAPQPRQTLPPMRLSRRAQAIDSYGSMVGSRNADAFVLACALFKGLKGRHDAKNVVFWHIRSRIPDDGSFSDRELKQVVESAAKRSA